MSSGPADFVTGATGFIGRHLAERLVEEAARTGREVRLLVRPASVGKLSPALRASPRVRVIEGDLNDRASLARGMAGAGRVFHCAGHVLDWGAEATFVAANADGTRNLLEAAVAAAREGTSITRFVHLSSIAVFGVPSPPRFDDATSYGPGDDLYSRTKIEGDRLALDFHRRHGLPVTVLRPPVVYGRYGTWAEEPIAMIRRKKMFLIGGGRGTCHPCFIDNLVDAMLLAAEHPSAPGQAFMVGDDRTITFREYFTRLCWVAGRPPVRRSIPLWIARIIATVCELAARARAGRGGRPLLTHVSIDMISRRSEMSIEKIKRDLGYRPRFTLDAAMERLRAQLPPA